MAKNSAKIQMLKRAKNIFLISIILMVVILLRIIYIQHFSSEVRFNSERLHERIFSWQEIPAHRGSILDRNGDPLAVSIYNYQVEMDYGSEGFDSPERFEQHTDSLSKLLARYFKDRSAAQYKTIMREGRKKGYQLRYLKDTTVLRSEGWWYRLLDRLRDDEWRTVKLYDTIRDHTPRPILPRSIDYTEWQTLKKWPIFNYNMGITYTLSRSDNRIYPHGDLARVVVGKSFDGKGTDYGIEAAYASTLEAQPGKIRRQRIARGFYGQVLDEGDNIDPMDGSDVVTTLDVDIQDVVTKALETELIRHNAIWGTSMVMEVETGNILAMANLGRLSVGRYSETKNYALQYRMEPGSTFKLASAMALLEDAGMSPDKIYDSGNGQTIMVGSAKVKDSHPGYNEVDLKTATVQSLNGYFAHATYDHYKDNPERLIKFLRSLHLDRSIGLEEFDAIEPNFRAPGDKSWYTYNTVPYLGFGYAIELSPIHTLTLYNAVANGGCMVAPQLIKSYYSNGKHIENNRPTVLNPKICSDRTLRLLREYLEEVAISGTAKDYMGSFKDFSVGAKTGTATYAQGNINYSDGYYVGSMVTYMPADKPKYTILTQVFTRLGNSYTIYGSSLTGRAQQKIVQHLYSSEKEWYDNIEEWPKEYYPRFIKGGEVKQIEEITYQLSPRTARHAGDSKWGEVSVDSLSKVEINDIDYSTTTMPNVVGMGLKDALFILESRGLKVRFSGKGAVRSQSIKAGAKISAGAVVSIKLS
ncbi:MAG: penicillin-binding transpeptidase domain-containing protein [Rikenellaceae bacterium]